MKTRIILLRGVNVSGHHLIKMAELKEHLTSLEVENVMTYIQSGNIVLRTADVQIDRKIAQLIKDQYNYDIAVYSYPIEEWNEIIAKNPFPVGTKEEARKVCVIFFDDLIDRDKFKAMQLDTFLPEKCIPGSGHLYFYAANGLGKARLNYKMFEKEFGLKSTTRNWNTLNKLAELAANINS